MAETPETEAAERELSETESKRGDQIGAWLVEKWGGPDKDVPCPFCGADAWWVDPSPVLLQRFGAPQGVGVPLFLVMCSNCGVEVPLNVNRIGLWDTLNEVTPEEATGRVRGAGPGLAKGRPRGEGSS